jgi:hypothetical protein
MECWWILGGLGLEINNISVVVGLERWWWLKTGSGDKSPGSHKAGSLPSVPSS